MFKFDKYTRAYHISNMIFYLFTLVVIGLIYVYGFYPPIAEVTSGDFFSSVGLRKLGGMLFFLVLIIVPLMVVYGAVYHLYKAITFGRGTETAEN